MKNSFSVNELLKKLRKREKCLFCKLLPFLNYPCILVYKKFFLTPLSISYTNYKKFLLCKLFFFSRVFLTTLSTNYIAYQRLFVWFTKHFCFEIFFALTAKKFTTQKKVLNLKENSILKRKFS